MHVNIDNENKLLEFWVFNDEMFTIPDDMTGLIDACKRLDYKICIFQSGSAPVVELTSDLIKQNVN